MTPKRFIRDNHTGYLYDNGEIVEDIMELLNALNDENEQLKKELDGFKPLIFETDGMPITLYEKKDGGDVE